MGTFANISPLAVKFFGGQVGDGEASGTALRLTIVFLMTNFGLAFGLALTEVGAAHASFGSISARSKEVTRVTKTGKRIFNDQTT